ncbi:class A beta-lactamase-related serine hydrolase [Bacillus salipaludis]|uniref:Class A beta-lactamase-related serine hydrolase n=1 Tax=Bacillus salipaludis TaxID=2547811 RepID=A0A4V3ASZ4_9BACI|nr:class A beta-lactamase-related serine hydrolase [Bacillus salipaludis]
MVKYNWNQLEAYINEKMKQEHIAGAAVGMMKNDSIIFQKGFGYRDLEAQLPVTPETNFGIASVTKSFTAMAILEMEAKGLLSVDDPVQKFLPEFNLKQVKDMESISIHHLLSHTTGLPPIERKEYLTEFSKHLSYLAELEINMLGKPGEFFSYCNDMFLLLGAIIEKISGKPYHQYMTETYLQTFQMNRSTYYLEELFQMENVSIPYDYNQKAGRLEKVAWPTLGNYEVGGGIRSNVVDLLKYGHVYLNNSYTNKMWNPIHKIGRNSFYGYALNVTPNYAEQYTLVQHGGGQPGVSSNFGFIPEENLFVVVLTNVGGVSAGNLWLAAVHTALGLPLEEKISEEPEYEMTLDEMRKFQGIYSSLEGDRLKIQIEGIQAFAVVEEQKYHLRASAPDTLVMIQNEKLLRFFFNELKQPWAVMYGLRMLVRENEF